MKLKPISAALIVLIAATPAFGQVDEAREAIERGEYARAVEILDPLFDLFLQILKWPSFLFGDVDRVLFHALGVLW